LMSRCVWSVHIDAMMNNREKHCAADESNKYAKKLLHTMP